MTPSSAAERLSTRIRVVDESADWVVVEKPPFLKAHPSKPGDRFTLWDAVRQLLAYETANGDRISIINRLDRETSGLTLVCKHREAARELSRRMMRREIRKEYLAIVWGWPSRDSYDIDAPLIRQGEIGPSRIWLKQAIHSRGAASRTEVRVEKRFFRRADGGEFSLVRAIPHTGRMHQIRVHLASVGHPIVGDKIYGPSEDCYLEFIRTGWTRELESRLILERHALHSAFLAVDPVNLAWESALAGDLAAFLDSGVAP